MKCHLNLRQLRFQASNCIFSSTRDFYYSELCSRWKSFLISWKKFTEQFDPNLKTFNCDSWLYYVLWLWEHNLKNFVDTFTTVDKACCEATRKRIRGPVRPVSTQSVIIFMNGVITLYTVNPPVDTFFYLLFFFRVHCGTSSQHIRLIKCANF